MKSFSVLSDSDIFVISIGNKLNPLEVFNRKNIHNLICIPDSWCLNKGNDSNAVTTPLIPAVLSGGE